MVRKEKLASVSHMLYVVFISKNMKNQVKTNYVAVFLYHLLHLQLYLRHALSAFFPWDIKFLFCIILCHFAL